MLSPRRLLPLAAVSVLLTGALAKPSSLLDPPVTIAVTKAHLSEVLKSLTEATGVPFQSPFEQILARVRQPGGGQPGGQPPPQAIEQMRARFDPEIDLTATDLPLRQVVAKLAKLTGFRFEPMPGTMGYMVMPQGPGPQPQGADDEAPSVTAGDYTVRIAGIRCERVREQMWAPMPRADAHDALQLFVAVDSPTNLAARALSGIDAGVQVQLDGNPLELMANRGQPPTLFQPGPSPAGNDVVTLTFQLPPEDGKALDVVSGELVVMPDARELVFEFAALDTPDQLLSDGPFDVTLQRWEPEAGGQPEAGAGFDFGMAGPVGGGGRGGMMMMPAADGPRAELKVSQPVSEALRQRFEPLLRGMGGGPGGGMVPPPPPPAVDGRPARPQQGAALPDQAQGRVVLAADGRGDRRGGRPGGGPGAGGPGGGQRPPGMPDFRGGGGPGDPQFFERARALMGGRLDDFLPLVATETANGGRRLAARVAGPRDVQFEDDRVTYTVTVLFPQLEGEVSRLLVSLTDPGETTTRVPFLFTGLELPSGQPPDPRRGG